MATYTVKKGDCLWNIAKSQLKDPYRWTEIADLNNISRSRPTIYPGNVLQLPGSTPEASTQEKNPTYKAEISYFGLLTGSRNQILVTWRFDQPNIEKYEVKWEYYVENGFWLTGQTNSVEGETDEDKENLYSAPDNALQVRVSVKPISEKKKVDDTEVDYFKSDWSAKKTYNFDDLPPDVISTPTVTLDGLKLTATLSNIDVKADQIDFQVVRDDSTEFVSSQKVKIVTTVASHTWAVDAGHNYKVRARAYRTSDKSYGEYSQYSNNVGTPPAASSGITTIRGDSETSIYLEWGAVTNARTYELEYATKREYFDGSDQTTKISSIENNHYLKTGLESGQEYFFRVRAVNTDGNSAWSDIKSIVIGTTPAAPTTWSSTTTSVTGEMLTLFWVHNAEDGSYQTYAEVELYVNGVREAHTVNTVNQKDDEKTMYYEINTSQYIEGTKIDWRVRTAGATKEYGEWSVQRTVNVYAQPTLTLNVTDVSGNSLSTLSSFPMYVTASAGPNTQRPVSYHVTITANESYETVDNLGNPKFVITGEKVYSQYYDTSVNLTLQISAGSVDLENNVSYTIRCTVAMDSGLTAEAELEFTVTWSDRFYPPNAEIGINHDDLSAYIRPYCSDISGALIADVTLSVYRREFDGSFTEIATGLENRHGMYVTDPHPALDFARYRIVAITRSTGAVSYYDVPGYPVQEKAVVLQWNERWANFEATDESALESPPWSGSLLKLPYNINVSEKVSPDVSLVSYIGRKHPVSYYGTQLGETASWSMSVIKSDKETVYALRRLAVWMGDVYVREPSGTGYWANVKVNFSQNHTELIIPVTLDITRVEGGV